MIPEEIYDFISKVEWEDDFMYVIENYPQLLNNIEPYYSEFVKEARELLIKYNNVINTYQQIVDSVGR